MHVKHEDSTVEHDDSTGGGIILALVYGLPAFMMGLLVGLAL